MSNVLGRVSTLAYGAFHSGDLSSIQISVESDVLASYLGSNTALGPAIIIII